MNGGRKVNLESLRQRAEQVLHEVSEGLESRLSVPTMAIHELVHELHVYQAELELQNEELQESQARLLRSSAKYQTLFHSMPLPAVLCDDRGFVVEANVAAQKLLGVNSFIVEQRYALSQFISLGSRSVVDSMLNSPASGPVQARICNIRTRVEIPCQLFFQALCDQTPDCFSQILIVDRTSEVELERARLDAEAASRAKSTFLAKMSHELRTPFNGVLGMIELARRRMTDPQGLLRLDAADHSARQLLGIVDEILDLARVESGRLKLEQVPFSIGTVLDDVVAMHEPASEEKGLRLKIVADDMGMVSVIGDPGRFQQVISNLVGNAIKFSTAGGIRIFVRREREEQAHIWVRTEVHDDGIGISEEAQRRIFSPFEQADNSTTRKHGGTGLGLAICKQLVELAGGTIGVVSNRGEGCQFWWAPRITRGFQ